MRKMTGTQRWIFGGGPETPTQSWWRLQGPNPIQTGARWCGDHGLVMEICRVDAIHELAPSVLDPDGNEEQQGTPGGYIMLSPGVPGSNVPGYLTYTLQLTCGRLGSFNASAGLSDFHPNVIFSSKVINEAVMALNTGVIDVKTRLEETSNDLTDGAGNGYLVAVPTLYLEGSTVFNTQLVKANDYTNKLLTPPWINDQEERAGKSYINIWYKYREVDYATWTAVMQAQNTKLF